MKVMVLGSNVQSQISCWISTGREEKEAHGFLGAAYSAMAWIGRAIAKGVVQDLEVLSRDYEDNVPSLMGSRGGSNYVSFDMVFCCAWRSCA